LVRPNGIYDRLVEGESGHLNFKEFYAELEQLRSETELDNGKIKILNKVEEFGRELEEYLLQKV